MERWKEDFEVMLNTNQPMQEQEEENQAITEPVEGQDQGIKFKKSVDHDSVTPEKMTTFGERSVKMVTKLLSRENTRGLGKRCTTTNLF